MISFELLWSSRLKIWLVRKYSSYFLKFMYNLALFFTQLSNNFQKFIEINSIFFKSFFHSGHAFIQRIVLWNQLNNLLTDWIGRLHKRIYGVRIQIALFPKRFLRFKYLLNSFVLSLVNLNVLPWSLDFIIDIFYCVCQFLLVLN